MSTVQRFIITTFATAVLLLQGCSLMAPKEIDPVEQQITMERFKRCIQRPGIDATIFCEGHRRDVLAIYPLHLHDHVDALLAQKFDENQPQTLFKTGASVDTIKGNLRSTFHAREAENLDL